MKNIAIGILAIIGLIYVLTLIPNETLQNVKSGKWTLDCQLSSGWKTIDPSKVIDLNDENGYWTFTNGYAKHCIVTK